jgi:protein phosphatase
MAIDSLRKELRDSESLSAAVRSANKAIYDKASTDPDLSGMGTTITAMYAGEDSAQIVHVGDSRAYLLRDGELSRITQDHTVVGRLVQQGRISPQDADRHPQRSYLERALGVDPNVEVDVHVLKISAGDRILLCSDGLFGMIDDDQILAVLKSYSDPQEAAEGLCQAAVQAGGSDNVTAVIVDYPASPTRSYSTPSSASQRGYRTTGPIDEPRPSGPTIAPPSAPSFGGPASGYGVPASAREPEDSPRPPRSHWGRRLAMVVVALALLVAAGVAARLSISRSWYVGVNQGQVTIFNGVRGSVGGVDLSKVEQRTDIATANLPELYRGRLEEGISARNREDAASIVADLQRLASPAPPTSPAPPEATPSQ